MSTNTYAQILWHNRVRLCKSIDEMYGVSSRLKARVIMCVSSIIFLALNNNKPYERILPKEGLRQGDPLFPFLFVLCNEEHINMLAKG